MLSYEQRMNHAYNSMNSTPSPESDFSQEYGGRQVNAMDTNTAPSGLRTPQLNNDQVRDIKIWADQVSTAQKLTPDQFSDMHALVNVNFYSPVDCA